FPLNFALATVHHFPQVPWSGDDEMLFFPVCKSRRTAILFFFCVLLSSRLRAQSPPTTNRPSNPSTSISFLNGTPTPNSAFSFIGVFIPFPDGRLSSIPSTTSPRRTTSSTTLTRNGT